MFQISFIIWFAALIGFIGAWPTLRWRVWRLKRRPRRYWGDPLPFCSRCALLGFIGAWSTLPWRLGRLKRRPRRGASFCCCCRCCRLDPSLFLDTSITVGVLGQSSMSSSEESSIDVASCCGRFCDCGGGETTWISCTESSKETSAVLIPLSLLVIMKRLPCSSLTLQVTPSAEIMGNLIGLQIRLLSLLSLVCCFRTCCACSNALQCWTCNVLYYDMMSGVGMKMLMKPVVERVYWENEKPAALFCKAVSSMVRTADGSSMHATWGVVDSEHRGGAPCWVTAALRLLRQWSIQYGSFHRIRVRA